MIAKKLAKLHRAIVRTQFVIPRLFAETTPPRDGQPLAALEQLLLRLRDLFTGLFSYDRKKNMLPPPSVLRARKRSGLFSTLARRNFPK